MRKRDEISNLSSCLNKAHEDEPVFVLRANDPLAAGVVALWAELYMKHHDGLGTFTAEREHKYKNALYSAQLMYEWREKTSLVAAKQPETAAEALNAIREKVHVKGDELILRHGFWVTLRESLGLEQTITRGTDENQAELFR